ncbi:hypothetical protein GWI33_013628 [Rhynchophorus ferrugineus]|uniref:Uncharacterized protein n=1 Tax=Rhynchophorus ferrugineus TaxID=354439 RepID=A0A834I6N8_RHYFE|nr:hypothetical protein GWI33_013628 [Rhynchophorus ferrugineus]
MISEYETIEKEVYNALENNRSIKQIKRIQNIYDLGQLLIREQFLITKNPSATYYRERRFVAIPSDYYELALRHNLDHRRCGLVQFGFSTKVYCGGDSILFAVQVINKYPSDNYIEPKNSHEYFIDYAISFY